MNRRDVLKNLSLAGALGATAPDLNLEPKINKPKKTKFSYCYNSSTTRGQKVPIDKEVELVSKAGYDGIEVWVPVLNEYKKSGKSLKDLGKKIKDLGLVVQDAIGFAQWIHEDVNIRSKALEQVKAEMDMLAELGCTRIAAPPAGATDKEIPSYDAVGERYLTLLETGVKHGVIPQLELWGFSKTLFKLSQLLYVAAQVGHPNMRLLTDVYHLYKGQSKTDAMKLISSNAIEIFHMNDYRSNSNPLTITDADRIYPGDGVAPFETILKDLATNREQVVLSLELFNPEYYKQDAAFVMKTGLDKMKAVVQKSINA